MNPMAMLAWSIGWPEIVVILVVVLLLFGARRVPELMRSLAKGLKSFKHEMKNVSGELKDTDADETAAKPQPPESEPTRQDEPSPYRDTDDSAKSE